MSSGSCQCQGQGLAEETASHAGRDQGGGLRRRWHIRDALSCSGGCGGIRIPHVSPLASVQLVRHRPKDGVAPGVRLEVYWKDTHGGIGNFSIVPSSHSTNNGSFAPDSELYWRILANSPSMDAARVTLLADSDAGAWKAVAAQRQLRAQSCHQISYWVYDQRGGVR